MLARLTELGFACYVPFGVGKADLVIETSDGLKSVQCKTGRLSADGSIINFRTNTVLRSGETQDYRGAVDYFAVCAKGVSGVFLLRVDSVPRWQCHLRLRPSNNGQVKGVLPAEMYRI